MKVHIRNLGAIKEAEVDLKPFTVFIGPNNSGKTWMAYTLAGIFGQYGWTRYTKAYALGKTPVTYPSLDTAIQQVLNEGTAVINLVQFADEYAEKYINDVAHLAPQWMPTFMSTQRTFTDLEIHIDLAEAKEKFLERVLNFSQAGEPPIGQQKRKPPLNAIKEKGKPTLYFYTEGNVLEKFPDRTIKEFFAGRIFEGLHRGLYSDTCIFPTERTTFITIPFSTITTRTMAPEFFESDQRSISGIWLVGHFLRMVFDAVHGNLLERVNEAKTDRAIEAYLSLAALLEKEVLSGSVDFSAPEIEPWRDILFRPAKDIALEMRIVSSMVKELAPLVLYLRYLAESGDWLIIDEPEMNLHPEAQVKITEFLAMLVQAGLPVLITTHSPYIVDHLTNLMKAAEVTDKEAAREKFYLQRTDSFISKEQVSVYEINEGTAKNIIDEDGRIQWNTFGLVSDRVSEIYFEL